jgi:kynurenine formamidase
MPWSADTPPFPTDPAPVVKWIKRLSSHGTNHQLIETPLHVGTHMDAPLHWADSGSDIASIPLEQLCGTTAVIDLSGQLADFSVIDPRLLDESGLVEDGDRVIVHTGYHRYSHGDATPDEVRYFWKHPGGMAELAEWALDRKLGWIGVDMSSPDHPMNSNLRRTVPTHLYDEAEAAAGRPLDEAFPSVGMQVMHVKLCRGGLPIIENIAGDIDSVLNKRITTYAFPWRFVGGEAALIRLVAVRPEDE